MENFIALLAVALALACLFAQLKIINISSTLDEVHIELQLMRLQHMVQIGRISDSEFEQRAQKMLRP